MTNGNNAQRHTAATAAPEKYASSTFAVSGDVELGAGEAEKVAVAVEVSETVANGEAIALTAKTPD